MTYKNDDELLREILDAMVTCDGFVSRVAAQCHVNVTTIFRWLAASEINPEANKLEWGENGLKPFHVHAKLARRMGRLVARSDYFDDETPQPEKPAPYVDDAEEVVDDAARIARARADVAKGPQMHPPRRSHERMLEDDGMKIPTADQIDMRAIMQGARDAQAHRDQLEGAVIEAAGPVDGDLTSAPAPVSTGDGRADELARLLARIEARGTPPTALEADVIARLEQAPTRPRPQGAPVAIGKPEDEPGQVPLPAPAGLRRPWTPTGAAPAPRRAPDVDRRPDPQSGTKVR